MRNFLVKRVRDSAFQQPTIIPAIKPLLAVQQFSDIHMNGVEMKKVTGHLKTNEHSVVACEVSIVDSMMTIIGNNYYYDIK